MVYIDTVTLIHFIALSLFRELCARTQGFHAQLLTGQDVVHHRDVADKDRVRDHRHIRQAGDQFADPACTPEGARIGAKGGAKLRFHGRRVKYRTHHENQTLPALRFRRDRPLHPDRGADQKRNALARVKISDGLFDAAERTEACFQKLPILLRTGAGDIMAVRGIAPDVKLFIRRKRRLQQQEVLLAARHLPVHGITPSNLSITFLGRKARSFRMSVTFPERLALRRSRLLI